MKSILLAAALVLSATGFAEFDAIKARIKESNEKMALREWADAKHYEHAIYSTPESLGADYAPVLKAKIDALPASGGVVVVPVGRYYFKSQLIVTKPNVTLKAEKLGDVVFEEARAYDFTAPKNPPFSAMVQVMKQAKNFRFENFIVFGTRNKANFFAIMADYPTGMVVSGNLFKELDGAVKITRNYSVTIENNVFLDNGYFTTGISGSRDENGICTLYGTGAVYRGNFYDNNYQNIHVYCQKGFVVENNISRRSHVAGIRLESSIEGTIARNFVHWSDGAGIWFYGQTQRNNAFDNIVVDNNVGMRPYREDCWEPQASLKAEFNNKYGPLDYATTQKDKGVVIFKNYSCQWGGSTLEFRNTAHENKITNNWLGQFEQRREKTETPIIRLSYYMRFYAANKAGYANRIIKNNVFSGNRFLGNDDLVKGPGCGNQFLSGAKYDILTGKASRASMKEEPHPICAEPADRPICNNNGVCETSVGEYANNCKADCMTTLCKKLGQAGSRSRYERCCPGLTMLDEIYPAAEGIVNKYEGDFTCVATPTVNKK